MRKIALYISWIACFLLIGNSIPGEEKNYEEIIDKFFSILFIQGKTSEAIDFLYKSNPWMERNQDAIDQVKSQIKELPSLVGQYHSHKLVHEKKLGDRFVYSSYMILYDRQPIRFEFRFYRPSNDWITYSFGFDYALADELRDQARRETVSKE